MDFVTSEITTEREREVLMVDRQREGGGKPGRERANAKGGLGGRGGFIGMGKVKEGEFQKKILLKKKKKREGEEIGEMRSK